MKYSKLFILGVVIAGSVFSCSMFKGKEKDNQETFRIGFKKELFLE